MKAKIGPCIVCGGRVLRNGKRKHDPLAHAEHRAKRDRAWMGTRRWPALRVEAVIAYWQRHTG